MVTSVGDAVPEGGATEGEIAVAAAVTGAPVGGSTAGPRLGMFVGCIGELVRPIGSGVGITAGVGSGDD